MHKNDSEETVETPKEGKEGITSGFNFQNTSYQCTMNKINIDDDP